MSQQTAPLELATSRPAALNGDIDPQQLLILAIEKGAPLEFVERLLEIRRLLVAEDASRKWCAAMNAFQAVCPVVNKNREVVDNKTGKVRYRYADLGSIIRQVGPLIAQHGFSYTVENTMDGACVHAIVEVSHIGGHRQSSSFNAPVDRGAFMSEPQKLSSAATYAKRIAFCNAFGILTGDDDDDNDIGNPNKGSVHDAERASLLENLQKLAISVYGQNGQGAWKAFLADRDPAVMDVAAIKELGAELKLVWKEQRAKALQWPCVEVADSPQEEFVAQTAQECQNVSVEAKSPPKGTSQQQKLLRAILREKWLGENGQFIGDQEAEPILYWWLGQTGLCEIDPEKNRVSLSKIGREAMTSVIDLLQNTPFKSILKRYSS